MSHPDHASPEALRRARIRAGLTMAELSRRTGVARATISNIENGKHVARLDTIAVLAKGLGVEIPSLLNGHADCPQPSACAMTRTIEEGATRAEVEARVRRMAPEPLTLTPAQIEFLRTIFSRDAAAAS